MKREEAIAILDMSKHMATSGRLYNEAIDMAIEALSERTGEWIFSTILPKGYDCYDLNFYDLSGEKIPANKLAEAFDMAIEALSERTGEWIFSTILPKGYKCSVCGRGEFFHVDGFNFCPFCGAEMRGEKE